ncbi:hypothetical protein ACFQ08_41765 [Streptosporangium algeriense]|uniref:Uncharacterized protein n=1 Tax=Streptosporangium algeriense TaxID=1682748 RepID=A0ABW3E6R7_9ACTN
MRMSLSATRMAETRKSTRGLSGPSTRRSGSQVLSASSPLAGERRSVSAAHR